MGRKVVDARVAEALEDARGKTTPSEGPAKKSEYRVSGDPSGDGSPPTSCSVSAPSGTGTPNPLILTTQLCVAAVGCGNHCATTRSGDSHHGTPVVGCGYLWSKGVAKNVCDGDQNQILDWHGERGSLRGWERPTRERRPVHG
jgi:hypothetical protein